jgi:alanyl-tRNA synthetase
MCFRSQDIEEVGDNRHETFFEMLGNWSLGDYFKTEQLEWFFTFLTDITEGLGLDANKLYVTVFIGDPANNIPKDTESIAIWKKLFASQNIDAIQVDLDTEENGSKIGMQNGRIFAYGVKKNWWARNGAIPQNMPEGEPGGPDSEVFYDFGLPHDTKYGPQCHPNCDCGRFLEIGNSVFMQYLKNPDGSLKELPQKNVDFGGGFERLLAAVSHNPDVFKTDLFSPLIAYLEETSQTSYSTNSSAMRIIADHFKASVFLISDGITPSNKAQGYFLRRLLRRSLVKLHQLGISSPDFSRLTSIVFEIYKESPFLKSVKADQIIQIIQDEYLKFNKTLKEGLKRLNEVSPFDLLQSYGFPPEVTEELLKQQGKVLDWEIFNQEKSKHQQLSRTSSSGMFKGGLQDQSEIVVKYHTATHLLHKALRDILGTHVQQKGSNITAERLRFDFSHSDKLTPTQIQLIEDTINHKIDEKLPVTRLEMSKAKALSEGALAFFPEKYPDVTSVYVIGDQEHWYSKELCGGPHVNSTDEIGRIKIFKEEAVSSGVRRIYAKISA